MRSEQDECTWLGILSVDTSTCYGCCIHRGEIGEDYPFCSIICYAIASSPSAPGHSPVRFSVVGDMLDVLSG